MPQALQTETIVNHRVAGAQEWNEARKNLLRKEKELTRLRDEISRERRELPWQEVSKHYIFDGPNGKLTLADLFEGRSQLIVYHFMFGPGWKEGCVGCSFLADHLDGPLQHLVQHDVSFAAVSRAPLAEIQPFQTRMGWKFKWVSSNDSDFNYDYHVSFKEGSSKVYYNYQEQDFTIEESSGISVFYREPAGKIYHTYSSYARGGEPFLGAYSFLDITPKGRDENGPTFSLGDWVRHHDRYGTGGHVAPTGRYVSEGPKSECGCESHS